MRTTMPQLNHAGEQPVILSGEGDAELASYINTLMAQRWLIALVALAVTLAGVLYAFVARPVYEATLMVQVEEKGQREPKNILGEAGAIIDYTTPASAEIELLRSRLVVSRAIDRLGLCIDARPDRFPVLGNWAAGLQLDSVLPALRGLGGYAWGDERIEVEAFDVPEFLENRSFELQALGGGRYRLAEPESGLRLSGRSGEALTETTSSACSWPGWMRLREHVSRWCAARGWRRSTVCRNRCQWPRSASSPAWWSPRCAATAPTASIACCRRSARNTWRRTAHAAPRKRTSRWPG